MNYSCKILEKNFVRFVQKCVQCDVPCCNMHDATQRHIAMKLLEKFVSIVLEQASKSIPIAMQKSPIKHIVSHRQYEMFFHTSS